MYPPPFEPKSRLSPVLTESPEINGQERHLEIFEWQDRLVAHEESSGLWWGTLDARGHLDAREFWRECLARERVGRLFSREKGILSKSNGVMMALAPRLAHVLVAHDNSGALQFDGQTDWHPFASVQPWGLHKPLATKPTIWSPRFHFKFARRSWSAIYARAAGAHLPKPQRDLWQQGASVFPLRLVATAFAVGWARAAWKNSMHTRSGFTLPQFWSAILENRRHASPSFAVAKEVSKSRTNALLESPEATFPGYIHILHNPYYQQGNYRVSFVWQDPTSTLRIEIENIASSASAHERLEARLELRDWLGQFFPPAEVESWFQQ